MTVYELITFCGRTDQGAPRYEEMAKLARVAPRTMRQWCSNGYIPKHRQPIIQKRSKGKLRADT